jgi:FkbM family methyltransferase
MSVRVLRRNLLHHLAKMPTVFGWMLLATGLGSVETQRYLRLIRRGEIVLDVGANLGNFTLLFSALVGPQGAVHSFEPVPPTFALLSERIRRDAHYRNIFTNPIACSEGRGTAEIIVPAGDLGQAAMRTHASGSWTADTKRERFYVPTTRLDDYVAERNLTRLDFIKCDAEGAELLVLRGATGLLKQFEPLLHLEVAEFWTRDFGYGPSDLADFLEEAGYSHFRIEEETVRPEELRDRLAGRAREISVNLLCACSSRAERLRGL